MNKHAARLNLLKSVRLVVDGLEMIGIPPLKSRDKREPGRKEKEDYENRLSSVIIRHFGRQRRMVRERLAMENPGRKSWEELYSDDDFIAELLVLLQKAVKDGVSLFGKNSKVQIDWTMTNQRAAEWAREYVGELIKDIDKKTLAVLQDAVNQFVQTPGMTIGDVMDLLPFDEERALRVAVTEITRTYATANQLAGEDLRKEFPDVRVIKYWTTNNDDRVCDLCGPLDGVEIDVDENFYEPEDAYQDGNPPRHVNCRCWIETTTALAELE